MPLNTVFSWVIKKRIHQIDLFRKYPTEVQNEWFTRLIEEGKTTEFGVDHGLEKVKNIDDFRKAVPIRNYDAFRPYIDRLREGEQGILWPSKLKWFAKSSGTTSAKSKYIPVSKECLENCHYKGGKDLLALYMSNNPEGKLYAGKNLVLGGSSTISPFSRDCYSGDLSAIIIKNLPAWVELKRIPNKEIALLDDWEEKIERMAHSTMKEDVSMLVGVPSWTMVLIKRILEIQGRDSILDVWPNLELFVHGGVSFKPYKEQFQELIPKPGMNYFQTYNASEGFFGIQDRNNSDDMLLMLDYGIYYEFLPTSEIGKENPQTLTLSEVQVDENYALVITTNSGLYRYLIGDVIKFTSINPFRIKVTGRTKLFINAFGEELIIDNAEEAIARASRATNAVVADYTAAPVYMDSDSNGAHEWLVEFDKPPTKLAHFAALLDSSLKEVNSDYEAKRSYNLSLREPIVRSVPTGTFYAWMKHKGKLGGQHKVPRLCNNRDFIDEIKVFAGLDSLKRVI